ncbi:MAG: response regulator transcription factor [Nitrospira sp.]|nr:response regulator transcription factor [Nitrospira sp.]
MPTTHVNTIRIMLVDDHEVVRVGLRTVLNQHDSIMVVGEAGTVGEAILQEAKLKPDIILMDVRLPDGSGVDACREILASGSGARVIFLTSFADDESVLAAVIAGAKGYILKEIDTASLLQAISSVAEGRSILDPTVVEQALHWLRGFAAGQKMPGNDKLSEQEERVLALVAEGKTNKEIATEMNLSDKTVKNYLTNVFKKLQITRRTQAAALFVKRRP